MNPSAIVLLINDSARAVMAIYEQGGSPALFKTMDQTIGVDDLVVVQTNTRHGMTIAKVTEVDVDIDFDSVSDIKWIVQRVDAKGFATVLEQEKDAVAAVNAADRRRKKEQLRASLFADHKDRIDALAISNVVDD